MSASAVGGGWDERMTDNKYAVNSAAYQGCNLVEDDMADIEAEAAADDDSNEIPVWVRGEARWIGGVTEHTTAADLVEALLLDDRSLIDPTSCTTTTTRNGTDNQPPSSVLQQFVITERWRQMEQILEPKTNVWKIWRAWGEAQNEVRLRLRKIDRNRPEALVQSTTTTSNTAIQQHQQKAGNYVGGMGKKAEENEDENGYLLYDSGRESPKAGSAIVRRRRHRASKSTTAWLTQAQTLHPKSSKSTIEKLMSLILEQGETIQQQLSKLRDREIQISQLEEQKHRIREQEHGKNYLLETYLNGLHEAEEKDLTTINSDSGVNTEDTQSPNGGTSPTAAVLLADKVIVSSQHQHQQQTKKSHFEYSVRENELLREHLKLKLTGPPGGRITLDGFSAAAAGGAGDDRQRLGLDGDSQQQQEIENEIDVLEKIYAINKHLQKEEELLVRLNAKIKRCESENPNLGEDEILDTLHRLNSEIEQLNREFEITTREIELSDELLRKKTELLDHLGSQMEQIDENDALMLSGGGPHDKQTLDSGGGDTDTTGHFDFGQPSHANCLGVSPENIQNISKILLKYSNDDDVAAPETERDWHDDRVNLAACHQAPINKTGTNKRIIIDNNERTTDTRPLGSNALAGRPPLHTVITTVQIHGQPGGEPTPGQIVKGPAATANAPALIDYATGLDQRPTGTHYLSDCYTATDEIHANVTHFTQPVDLIASTLTQNCGGIGLQASSTTAGPGMVTIMNPHSHLDGTNNSVAGAARVSGISDKVGAINSSRNISATLMDNKKLATKNFMLMSKAYEGLSPVVVVNGGNAGAAAVSQYEQQYRQAPPPPDMTQLGTLV